MHVHLVFVTKYRREVFTKEILADLHGIFSSVCNDFEAKLVEFDGEDDHVHLLVNYPPKVSASNLVNSLKGVSSRMIRKNNYPSIRKKLWAGALWSRRMRRNMNTTSHQRPFTSWRALVAQLLRRKLRRRSYLLHSPVH